MTHFGVETDIRKLMEDAEDIYNQTRDNPYTDRRKSRLRKLATDFNKEHKHEGISLTFVDDGDDRGLHVILNVPKRREYCAHNGIAFQMPKTIPFPQPKIIPKSRNRSFRERGGGGDGCGGDGGGGGGC